MAALLESVTRATALFERAATAESQTRREVIEILAQRQVDQAKDSADLLLGVRDTLSKQQSSNQEVTDAQKEQLQRIDALLEQVRPALERFGVTPTARMIDRTIDPNPAGIEGQGLAAEPIITDLTRAIDRLVRFLDEVFPLVPGTRGGPPLRPRTFGSAANFSDDRNNDLLINVADNNGKASLFNPTPQVIDEVAAPNLPPPPVRERPSILPETTTSEIFKVNDAARQLGFTFSSAFEDAVIAGRSFSDVLKGLGDDITRILLRLTVTQPLSNLITGVFSGAFGGTGVPTGKAGGGLIRGPGTGTSDSILAALSDGEFVVNAAATRRHRTLLEAINSGQAPSLQDGGLVGATPRFDAPDLQRFAAGMSPPVVQVVQDNDEQERLAKKLRNEMLLAAARPNKRPSGPTERQAAATR